MGLSLFLAKFLGLYMLIVAALWLLRKHQFEVGARDIISSPGLLIVAGAIHLMLGLAIAISHPVWEVNWRGLITLLGYVMIVQGVLRMGFSQEIKGVALKALSKGYWIAIVVLIVIGVFLTYNGFMDHPKAGFLGFQFS